MGEFSFKALLIIVLGVVTFLAFKAGVLWKSHEKESEPSCEIVSEHPSASVSGFTRIAEVEIEHNITLDGVPGIIILPTCDFVGLKGKECMCLVSFEDEKHNPLQDTNGQFCFKLGEVGGSFTYTPNTDNDCDVEMRGFFPYDELHVKSLQMVTLTMASYIIHGESILAEGQPVSFNYQKLNY